MLADGQEERRCHKLEISALYRNIYMYVSAGPPWGHQAARVIEFASSLAVLIWWLHGFQSFPVLYAAVL